MKTLLSLILFIAACNSPHVEKKAMKTITGFWEPDTNTKIVTSSGKVYSVEGFLADTDKVKMITMPPTGGYMDKGAYYHHKVAIGGIDPKEYPLAVDTIPWTDGVPYEPKRPMFEEIPNEPNTIATIDNTGKRKWVSLDTTCKHIWVQEYKGTISFHATLVCVKCLQEKELPEGAAQSLLFKLSLPTDPMPSLPTLTIDTSVTR